MKSSDMSTRFYRKLRKLNDQKKVSKRELLGLYFDLYELLMAMSEESRAADLFEAMAPPPGMMKMFKLPGGEEKDDKKKSKEDPGQYL